MHAFSNQLQTHHHHHHHHHQSFFTRGYKRHKEKQRDPTSQSLQIGLKLVSLLPSVRYSWKKNWIWNNCLWESYSKTCIFCHIDHVTVEMILFSLSLCISPNLSASIISCTTLFIYRISSSNWCFLSSKEMKLNHEFYMQVK